MFGVRCMMASNLTRFGISALRILGSSFRATWVNPLAQRDCCFYPGGRAVLVSRKVQHAAELDCIVPGPSWPKGCWRGIKQNFALQAQSRGAADNQRARMCQDHIERRRSSGGTKGDRHLAARLADLSYLRAWAVVCGAGGKGVSDHAAARHP